MVRCFRIAFSFLSPVSPLLSSHLALSVGLSFQSACTSTLCTAFKKYLKDDARRQFFLNVTDCFSCEGCTIGSRNFKSDTWAWGDNPEAYPVIPEFDFSSLPAKCNCGCVAWSCRLYYGFQYSVSDRIAEEVNKHFPFFAVNMQTCNRCSSPECDVFRKFFADFFISNSGKDDETAVCSCGYLKAFFHPLAEEDLLYFYHFYTFKEPVQVKPEPASEEVDQVVPSRKRKSGASSSRSTRSKK